MRTLEVSAVDSNLNTVMTFVDEALEELGCSFKAQMQIDVAVEELFINIAHYAYAPDTGDAVIATDFNEETGIFSILFTDSGVPYDPLAKPDPDVTASVDERQIGGLGIFMVKKSMDDMVYEYKDGQNILRISKKIV